MKYTNKISIPRKKYDIEYVKYGDYLFDKGCLQTYKFDITNLYLSSTTNDLDIYWYCGASEKDQPIIGINCVEKIVKIDLKNVNLRNSFQFGNHIPIKLDDCEFIFKFTDYGWNRIKSNKTVKKRKTRRIDRVTLEDFILKLIN